jgi:hypothetical protein
LPNQWCNRTVAAIEEIAQLLHNSTLKPPSCDGGSSMR